MTTQAQREEHKRTSILAGYRNQVESHNTVAVQAMKEKYPQYREDFEWIDKRYASC